MPTYMINGVPVQFPFEPYTIQKNYMEKVIACLQNGTNGVLESPTGTGKTLSLLCSSLAWLNLKKIELEQNCKENDDFKERDNLDSSGDEIELDKPPRIIYSSRTHSQLSQAINELKRTAYCNTTKAVVSGSRNQLCIHPDVIKEDTFNGKVNVCQMKRKTRTCEYYNRVEKLANDQVILGQSIFDIEDLCRLGHNHRFCPYFMAGKINKNADIIFMPYNYILDVRLREYQELKVENSVIILDEAHNIEKICEDSASITIRSTDITFCIEEIEETINALKIAFNTNLVENDLKDLKLKLLNFEKVVDKIYVALEGSTYPGTYMIDLLKASDITFKNVPAIIDLIEKIIEFLTNINEDAKKGSGLHHFEDMLKLVFLDEGDDYLKKINKCYKVHVVMEDINNKTNENFRHSFNKSWTKSTCKLINYWCFSPNFGMSMLINQGAKCVILTSGTLSPLNTLINELGIKVGEQLINPHIINEDQILVRVLTSGPDSEKLNSSYQNRNNKKYISSLGRAILNLSRIIPDGMLIFFPSYVLLEKFHEQWQYEGILASINLIKPVFIEPRKKDEFDEAINDYYALINEDDSKGAIFIGVCRGKVSEGLDFVDANGRAVLIVGLPYPPLKDARIILKKQYLDNCNAEDKQCLRGNDWYNLEAVRAVNQAMGRVIRHRFDYGAIILLDERFTQSRIKSEFSHWIRSRLITRNNFGEIVRDVRCFFKNAKEKHPIKEVKRDLLLQEPDLNFVGEENFHFSDIPGPSYNRNNSKRPKIVFESDKISDNI